MKIKVEKPKTNWKDISQPFSSKEPYKIRDKRPKFEDIEIECLDESQRSSRNSMMKELLNEAEVRRNNAMERYS